MSHYLPEGWEGLELFRVRRFVLRDPSNPTRSTHMASDEFNYIAQASPMGDGCDGDDGWSGEQPTPAAALRVLTAKLRGRA